MLAQLCLPRQDVALAVAPCSAHVTRATLLMAVRDHISQQRHLLFKNDELHVVYGPTLCLWQSSVGVIRHARISFPAQIQVAELLFSCEDPQM